MLTGSDCCSTAESSDRSTVGSDLIGSTTNCCCCSLSYLPGSMTLDQVLCLKGFYVKKWTCKY